MEIIKRDNRDLKRQIIDMKNELKRQEATSKETLNRIYELKNQEKRHINDIRAERAEQKRQVASSKEKLLENYPQTDGRMSGLQSKTSRKISSSLREIRSTSLYEIEELQKEIETLKTKKKEVEKDLV